MFHLLSSFEMTLKKKIKPEKWVPWVAPEAPHSLLRHCLQVGKVSHREVKPEIWCHFTGGNTEAERGGINITCPRSHSFWGHFRDFYNPGAPVRAADPPNFDYAKRAQSRPPCSLNFRPPQLSCAETIFSSSIFPGFVYKWRALTGWNLLI